MMRYTCFTEKGPRRKNEDSLKIVEVADKRTLFVVCDGMGGHSCGEVASRMVCEAFSSYWEDEALRDGDNAGDDERGGKEGAYCSYR